MQGYLNYTDINFDPDKHVALPQGTYKCELKLTAGPVYVGYGYIVMEVKSEMKDSFGR